MVKQRVFCLHGRQNQGETNHVHLMLAHQEFNKRNTRWRESKIGRVQCAVRHHNIVECPSHPRICAPTTISGKKKKVVQITLRRQYRHRLIWTEMHLHVLCKRQFACTVDRVACGVGAALMCPHPKFEQSAAAPYFSRPKSLFIWFSFLTAMFWFSLRTTHSEHTRILVHSYRSKTFSNDMLKKRIKC